MLAVPNRPQKANGDSAAPNNDTFIESAVTVYSIHVV